jgi:hypothetical protein
MEALDVDQWLADNRSATTLVANTCGWSKCPHCAALRAFVEKWNNGEIPHDPEWEKDWA